MYNAMFLKHLGNFQMHYLGLDIVGYVTEAGAVQLENLSGELLNGVVNGRRLRVYTNNHSVNKGRIVYRVKKTIL